MAEFKETKDYTFAKFCDLYKKFGIPHFQRPYAWTNRNIQDLWDSIISNDEKYFIGNIVAVKSTKEDFLFIVDGQQRLITISLLLSAIRDYYTEISTRIRNEIDKQMIAQRKMLINRYLKDEDLSKVPAEEYKRLILGKPEYQKVYNYIVDGRIDTLRNDNHIRRNDNLRRFIKNYDILKRLISDYIQGSELSRLEEILNKTLKLQFILIVCSNDNDIYGIFEGFNSTGLGLSVADLVKNALLRETQNIPDIQKEIEANWNELERLFENTSVAKFPKFLRHQWISEEGYVSTSHLYSRIKSERIEGKNCKDLLKYSQTLLEDAKFYLGIQYRDYEKYLELLKDDVKNSFKKFRSLKNEQVYELLLSYYKKFLYQKEILRPGVLNRILRNLWIFTVRARFVSVSPSDYEKIFAEHCQQVKSSRDSNDISRYSNSFFSKLKKLVSSKDQFVENFVSDLSYPKDKGIIMSALLEIMVNEDSEIMVQKPSIEHILPLEPNKWGLKREDVQDFVNKIGNLTILTQDYNNRLGNETLETKIKEVYSKSHFSINKEIGTKWKDKFLLDPKNAIEERSIEIAEKIEKIWSL